MTVGLGIGGHHTRIATRASDEWLTPPALLARLGAFDLDPCAMVDQPWPTALRQLTIEDDGLAHRWAGRVWLNPPYGTATYTWLRRLARHGDGIALVFARTETAGFFDGAWARADALLFLRGRLTFCRPDGSPGSANSGGPSVLLAYGYRNVDALAGSGLPGALVRAWDMLSPRGGAPL